MEQLLIRESQLMERWCSARYGCSCTSVRTSQYNWMPPLSPASSAKNQLPHWIIIKSWMWIMFSQHEHVITSGNCAHTLMHLEQCWVKASGRWGRIVLWHGMKQQGQGWVCPKTWCKTKPAICGWKLFAFVSWFIYGRSQFGCHMFHLLDHYYIHYASA